MGETRLINLLEKRQDVSLPGEHSDIAGELRLLSTEEEMVATANAQEALDKMRVGILPREDKEYWTAYFQNVAVLQQALVQKGTKTPLFGSASLMRNSLTKHEVDYLYVALKDFEKTVMPKFSELSEEQCATLLEGFLAQSLDLQLVINSFNLRELRTLALSSANLFSKLLSVNGLGFTSLSEPLTSTVRPPATTPN